MANVIKWGIAAICGVITLGAVINTTRMRKKLARAASTDEE
jgi:hypothetical protein